MLIACPQCSATYDVPAERVPPGREVRCARCITLWTPVPTGLVMAEPTPSALHEALPDIRPVLHREPVAPPVPDPMPALPIQADPVPASAEAGAAAPVSVAVDEAAVAEPPARRDRALIAAWTLTAAVLAGVGWFGLTQRAAVIQAWPPSERLYVALGLEPRH